MVDVMDSITRGLGTTSVLEMINSVMYDYIKRHSPKLRNYKYADRKIKVFIELVINELRNDSVMDGFIRFEDLSEFMQNMAIDDVSTAIRFIVN